jgi:hypothetical protein
VYLQLCRFGASHEQGRPARSCTDPCSDSGAYCRWRDGSVKHVHVIRASSGQRDSIEKALALWKLKPDEIDGRTNEIETGLLIKFTAAGGVNYSTRNAGLPNGRP